jgi:broad specificity phosphatase PhoE
MAPAQISSRLGGGAAGVHAKDMPSSWVAAAFGAVLTALADQPAVLYGVLALAALLAAAYFALEWWRVRTDQHYAAYRRDEALRRRTAHDVAAAKQELQELQQQQQQQVNGKEAGEGHHVVEVEEEEIHLYLIRHAESEANTAPGVIGGQQSHVRITARGWHQAELCAARLHAERVRFDRVYSSTALRAYTTACIVCRGVGYPLRRIGRSAKLLELGQGAWTLQPRTSVYTEAVLRRVNHDSFRHRAPGRCPVTGNAGESQLDVELRMHAFVREHITHCSSSTSSSTWPAEPVVHRDAKSSSSCQVHDVFLQLDGTDKKQKEQHHPHVPCAIAAHKNSSSSSSSSSSVSGEDSKLDSSTAAAAAAASIPIQNKRRKVTRVAIFSHGFAIKCFLRGVLAASPATTYKQRMQNTAISVLVYRRTNRGWWPQRINDAAHLAGERTTAATTTTGTTSTKKNKKKKTI